MGKPIRIGTRESQLAVWQASEVKLLLEREGFEAELVYIKSEGDVDQTTPLYEMGVQGIFTRTLDIALLNGKIDLAVHSMKDVPTQLPKGISQAAVLQRGPVNDLLVFRNNSAMQKFDSLEKSPLDGPSMIIATSSIRRKAQWLNRYPKHKIENLRGNVNTRLKKLQEENWDAAIFAQAGLERIDLRPPQSIILDWMLPAPAQGAILVVARQEDSYVINACMGFNHSDTEFCTRIERDFLRTLLGGCSTPISALATIENNQVIFKGNIFSTDGKIKMEVSENISIHDAGNLGVSAAKELLLNGASSIVESIRHAGEQD